MNQPSVFVTRKIALKALDRLENVVKLEVWPLDSAPPREVLEERFARVDGIISLLTDPIDQRLIDSAGPVLKVISQMAVGFDNIDIQTATRKKIPVGHTPGVLTETCADFTFSLLASLARRVTEGDREVRQGVWRPWGPDVLTGPDLYRSTLGIVGFGRIGQAVARRARGFEMNILYFDPQRHLELEKDLGVHYAPLDELLRLSDFVSVHTYLSPQTHKLFNKDLLNQMKPSAFLINTARGPIIDSEALVWALTEKKIAGAALDVFDPEPIPSDSPLLKMSNVIITPHIASASIATRTKMAHIAVDNLLAGLEGKVLPFCANPQVY